MKRNELIEAMGKIEDRFILEADEEVSSKKTKIFSFGEGKKWIKSSFVKTAIAACLILSVVLPNVSEKSAYALQAIPGLGRYFQLITLRNYSFDDGQHSAEVDTPLLAVEAPKEVVEAYGERSVAGASQDEVQDGISGEVAAKSAFKEKEDEKLASAEQINLDINAKTEELIREFKEELSKTEYKNLDVSYSVILNSEDYYVLALSVLKQEGDTQTIHHYYTVDKHSGELLQLAKLFPDRPDYKEILSEEVVRQIKAHNQNSKDKYFLQDGEDEEGFREVTDEQSFYINADGQLVLVFPQGEVAPMYMGESQFIIPKSIWQES